MIYDSDMKKRGDWLKERREELKKLDKRRFSVRAVAERIGISNAGLSHLENSDAMPSLDLAMNIARELDRPIEWVLRGTGDHSHRGIPVIGTTVTGPDIEWVKARGIGSVAQPGSEIVDLYVPGKNLYALKVTADPTLTHYHEGEVLIVDPDAQLVTGEDVVVPTNDVGGSVVKVLASQRDGKFFLDNQIDRQRMIRDLDEIIFIHPVQYVAKSHTIKKI